MPRSIHNDLLTTQTASSVQPAIQCVFTYRSGSPTYDYSFDPTVTTNRPLSIEHHEAPYYDRATIILRNNDLAVPALKGYYVDIGYGANTASGLRYGTVPRLWVKSQSTVSESGVLKTILKLGGVWQIMEEQEIFIGQPPLYQDEGGNLVGMTVYELLEYLIETSLTAETGYTFTLDALGAQDDGIINSYVPAPTLWRTDVPKGRPLVNPKAPATYDTYAILIDDLLRMTKCQLRVKSGGAFQVVYPQKTDAVDETFYSSLASGHVFYESVPWDSALVPNHVIVYSNDFSSWPDNVGLVTGEAKTEDDFDGLGVHDGPYMQVRKRYKYEPNFTVTQAQATNRAEAYLSKHQAETYGGRIIIPHDARVELYDRVEIVDSRGL